MVNTDWKQVLGLLSVFFFLLTIIFMYCICAVLSMYYTMQVKQFTKKVIYSVQTPEQQRQQYIIIDFTTALGFDNCWIGEVGWLWIFMSHNIMCNSSLVDWIISRKDWEVWGVQRSIWVTSCSLPAWDLNKPYFL